MKATLDNVKTILASLDEDFIYDNYFGIRVDECTYNIGVTANNSHQLFQDPEFDDDDELVYPYMESGVYAGFYDAGELDGTCCVKFDPTDDHSIEKALNTVSHYYGNRIHVLCGSYAQAGYDDGEIIIENASVIGVFEK